MRRLLLLLPALVLVVPVAGCAEVLARSALPGNAETDRVALIVSDAISWPRQESAAGLARAAQSTTAGRGGRLAVLAARDLEAGSPLDPMAELILLVHQDATDSGWTHRPAVDACYRARFSRYGVVDAPDRVRCPHDLTPVVVPPAPPQPTVPVGADRAVRAMLVRHGSASAPELRARLRTALPAPGPKTLPPAVDVRVAQGRAGVALRGLGDCLLARRTGARVEVWHPSDIQVAPGELPCSAATALAGQAQRPPH